MDKVKIEFLSKKNPAPTEEIRISTSSFSISAVRFFLVSELYDSIYIDRGDLAFKLVNLQSNIRCGWSLRCVVTEELNCNTLVIEFELQ